MIRCKPFSSWVLAFALLLAPQAVLAEDAGDPAPVEEPGMPPLEFGVSTTGVIQATSGIDEALGGDVTDGTAVFCFVVSSVVGEHGLAYALVEAGAGDGVDAALGLSAFNANAMGFSALVVSELWYEHEYRDGGVRMRAGLVDLSCDFDTNMAANSEKGQFMAPMFVNNKALELPAGGLGVLTAYDPEGSVFSLRAGAAEADADWEDVTDKPFLIAEAGIHPEFAIGSGNYRFYAWMNGADHAEILDPSNSTEDGIGFGLSFDQEVGGGVTLFLRYGMEDGSIYQFDNSISGGGAIGMGKIGRPDDAAGLALGLNMLSGDFKDLMGGEGEDEIQAEAYYLYAVNKQLSISPDIQWLANAGGSSEGGDIFAYGVRANLVF